MRKGHSVVGWCFVFSSVLTRVGCLKLFTNKHRNFYTLKMESHSDWPRLGYVDVHAHLIHEKFIGEEDHIAARCREAGLDFVVVNGLEPKSNRAILDLCSRHSNLLPALGIYPLDAACHVIHPGGNWLHPFDPPEKFDVDAEIAFIDSMAAEKRIVAVGECGLDKHYLTDEGSMAEQEQVLRKLMRVKILLSQGAHVDDIFLWGQGCQKAQSSTHFAHPKGRVKSTGVTVGRGRGES